MILRLGEAYRNCVYRSYIKRKMCLLWLLLLIKHLYSSDMWLGMAPITDTKKTWVLKRLDYMLKIYNHSRFNSQHNWGNLYDHLMSTSIFTLVCNKILI